MAGDAIIVPKPDPFLEQGTDFGDTRARPYKTPITLPNSGQDGTGFAPILSPENAPPAVSTTDQDEKWRIPSVTPDWQTAQPYSNITKLDEQLQARNTALEEARKPRTGSSAAAAIIAGTTAGALTEPLVKLTGVDRLFLEKWVPDPLTKVSLSQVSRAESKWITARGAFKNAVTAFGQTLVTGGLLSADEMLRERLYQAPIPSWKSSSLTIPLALTLGETLAKKSTLAAAAIVAGNVLDNAIAPPFEMPKELNGLSSFDAIFLGTAFAIPSKSKMAKAAIMGTAWLTGNLTEAMFAPPSAGDLEKKAFEALTADGAQRSKSSFDNAVDQFKQLGERNNIILEQDLAATIVKLNQNYASMPLEQQISMHRNLIAMEKAFAENYLQSGTRLSAAATSTPTYVLEGLNLDLGATALRHLLSTRTRLDQAQELSRQLAGQTAIALNQSELAVYDQVRDDINSSIGKILGAHDVPEAMKQMERLITKGSTSDGAILENQLAFHKTFVEDINQNLGFYFQRLYRDDGNIDPTAAMMTSKLLRDQVLAQLSLADVILETTSDLNAARMLLFGTPSGRNEQLPNTVKPKGYDGVFQALQIVEKLTPDSPDLPALKEIANRLAKRFPAQQ